jgi:SAM-dependent methyltransferase
MKQRLVTYLRCPHCHTAVSLENVRNTEGEDIMEGELVCSSQGHRFSITRGIPRFANLSQVEAEKAATASRFGWSWTHFSHSNERYTEQFLAWIDPVKQDFFKDKIVLEGGCGKGRHSRLAGSWGATDVIGVDLSSAVETAFEWTRDQPNVHIIQADIYHLPLARVFDYAFSVGVLHHLPDPRAGFLSVAAKVKPQGHISAWVYGAENNEWITRFVDPVREKFTSRISPGALLQLSKAPTALLFAATKLIYGPLHRRQSALGRKLFYYDYLAAISHFDWREHHLIVFDHLVAPTAYYISREEFEAWWTDAEATEVQIGWHNQNSWRGFGRLP